MRKFLAVIFLTIFTLQVIPLKVIGKFMNAGHDSEEVQDDAETGGNNLDGKVMTYGDDQIDHHYLFDVVGSTRGFNNRIISFIHRSETLPSVHIAAMPYPPPDNC